MKIKSNKLEEMKQLVHFLGQTLSSNCEIVLQDVTAGKIIAIENGSVSGRHVDSPLTDLALNMISNEVWKTSDYQLNYLGKTMSGKHLRSSTYFIKEDNQLIGLLCINIDTEPYEALSRDILSLCSMNQITLEHMSPIESKAQEHTDKSSIQKQDIPTENFVSSLSDSVNKMIETCMQTLGNIPIDRLSQKEKLYIISYLNDQKIFMIKGAISEVAKQLQCSEASIYRYLSKLSCSNS